MEQVLAHHGVLGMKWGVRKDGKSKEKSGASNSDQSKLVVGVDAETLKPIYLNSKVSNTQYFTDARNQAKDIALKVATPLLIAGGTALIAKMVQKNMSKFKTIPLKAITHSDTLTHYGVLGMRWGVRKDPSTRSTAVGVPQRVAVIKGVYPDGKGGFVGKDGKPVSPKKLKAAQEKAIKDRDKKLALENVIYNNLRISTKLSDQQLKEATARLNLENSFEAAARTNAGHGKYTPIVEQTIKQGTQVAASFLSNPQVQNKILKSLKIV